jgi:site-specific recombinase XerD
VLRGPYLHPTAARRFLLEQPGVRSARTVEKWDWVLRALQRRRPEHRVNEFTEADLLSFLTYADDGTPRTNAPATIVGYRVCFTSFFGWAHYAGLIDHNPAQPLARRVRPSALPVRHHLWLSEPEIVELLRTNESRDRVVLALGVFSGLRVHEIAALRWCAVNLQQAMVNVIGRAAKRTRSPCRRTSSSN